MNIARRLVIVVFGVGLMPVGAVALGARYVPIPGHRTLYAVIAAPFLALAAPLAFVVLIWGRRWLLAAVAASLTAALLVVQLPWYMRASATTDGAAVRVVTINMLYGRADPRAVAGLARDSADILLAQEVTDEAVNGLEAAGLSRTFPHQVIDARPGASGSAIYSRYPLTDSRPVTGYHLAMVTADVQPEGTVQKIALASVHFTAPWPAQIDGWHDDFARFPATLTEIAARSGTGAAIIGGDFNATIDMSSFRQLLTDGYRDSAEQSGSGRQFTFPSNRRYPPLIGIDHILTRNAIAVSTRTIEVAGTDHRALLATIMVLREPRLS